MIFSKEQRFVLRIITSTLVLACVAAVWFVYSEVYVVTASGDATASAVVTVEKGQSASALAERLHADGIIRSPWLFVKVLQWQKIDRTLQAGTFTVSPPVTVVAIAEALRRDAVREEREITILPGWDMREAAAYLEKEGYGTVEDIYRITGTPAERSGSMALQAWKKTYRVLADVPDDIGLEGYIAPDTYRVFAGSSAEDIIEKMLAERDRDMTDEMYNAIRQSRRTIHEVMTIASLVEREVRGSEDRALVADIFWRRYDAGWPLQADSTVHYVVGKDGSVFTSKADRESPSPWNTYKYPGLPPSPIALPSVSSIRAAIYPKTNDFWFFLTTMQGEVKYGRTLDEHNRNVAQYLR